VDVPFILLFGKAKRGEFAAVHTPKQIKARRGRPVGRVEAQAKAAAKLRLNPDVLAAMQRFHPL
jgi:uncharacterized protein (DUF4415 family)